MVRQLLLLFFVVFLSPLFPPLIMPFVYSVLGFLLIQKVDPYLLSTIAIVGSTLSCIVTRRAWEPVSAKIKEFKNKKDNADAISQIEKKVGKYFSDTSLLSRYTKKLDSYGDTLWGKTMFTLIVIFILQSSVPDIIAIRFLHKRVSFAYFVITSLLGKAVLYLPIIFLGTTAIAFIRTQFGW